MLYSILVIVQIVVALGLVGLVLMQHGKGADAGAAFGSGASGTVFGAKGSANFLSRTTAGLAAVFFAISLTLAYLVNGAASAGAGPNGSVTDQLSQQKPVPTVNSSPQKAGSSAAAGGGSKAAKPAGADNAAKAGKQSSAQPAAKGSGSDSGSGTGARIPQ